jgi:hypothetical protein
MNDENLIFEKYLNILAEADMPRSQYGLKAAAGAHKRGVSVTSPEEEQRHKDTRFNRNIESDVSKGNLINILDLVADDFGGRDEARSALMEYLRTDNINQKSAYNPFPEHPDIGPFVVPNFRLPDLISAIKAARNLVETEKERKLMIVLFNKLGSIYQENYGGNPNDDLELNAVRSFITKFVNRTFQGGERKVLQQVTFGGKSQRDDFEHVFVTNTRELQGPNWDRIKKISHLLFTGEERFNPDEMDSDTHVPERETPENLAGETLADPDRDAHQERLRTQQQPKKITKTKSPIIKKKSAPKKKPAPKVNKESYQFIKVISF